MPLLNLIYKAVRTSVDYFIVDLPDISPEKRREIATKVAEYTKTLVLEAVEHAAEGAVKGAKDDIS